MTRPIVHSPHLNW